MLKVALAIKRKGFGGRQLRVASALLLNLLWGLGQESNPSEPWFRSSENGCHNP